MSTIADRLKNLYDNLVLANSVTNEFVEALPDCYEAVEEKGGTVPAQQTAANLSAAIESIPSAPAPTACYLYVKTTAATSITISKGYGGETWNLEEGDNYLSDDDRVITAIGGNSSDIIEIDISHSYVERLNQLQMPNLTKLTLGDNLISNNGNQNFRNTKISNIIYFGKKFSWYLGYQTFMDATVPKLHFWGDIVPQFQYTQSGAWTDIQPSMVYVGHGDSAEEDNLIKDNLVANSPSFAYWNNVGKLRTWYSYLNS